MVRWQWVVLVVGLVASLAPAQGDRQALKRQLQSIQQEIQQLEQELRQTNRQLQNELTTLKTIDRQIRLTHEAIRLLKENMQLTEKEIQKTRQELETLNAKIAKLQHIFKQQVVFAYKFGQMRTLNWVLGARSINEAYLRYQYFRKISASARSIYDELVAARKQKVQLTQKLQDQLAEQQVIVQQKQAEEARLKQRRQQRRQVVEKIKRNRKLLAQAVAEKRRALKRIQQMIASLEQKKKTTTPPQWETDQRWVKLSGRFGKLKGKLNWPVHGRVIHKFGRYKSSLTGSVILNNGIDIRAKEGTPVRVVHSGIAVMVTMMGGIGNVVVVDHNDGYYTVYAHLDNVYVQEGAFVESGTVIGTVGESGSMEGPKLYFAVHKGSKPQNPLKWLRRR